MTQDATVDITTYCAGLVGQAYMFNGVSQRQTMVFWRETVSIMDQSSRSSDDIACITMFPELINWEQSMYIERDNLIAANLTLADARWPELPAGAAAFIAICSQGAVSAGKVILSIQVNAERDRRIFGGFKYNGVVYQTDSTAITNILGATQLAQMAIIQGAVAGNLRWVNPNNDFYWIAMDNSSNPMDAPTVVNFAVAVAAYRTTITYAGRLLKNAILEGSTVDYTLDVYWGVGSDQPTSNQPTQSS